MGFSSPEQDKGKTPYMKMREERQKTIMKKIMVNMNVIEPQNWSSGAMGPILNSKAMKLRDRKDVS